MRGIGHGSGQVHQRPDAREQLVWVSERVGVQRHDGGFLIDDPDFGAVAPLGEPCLVACFDGTGFWPDGSIAGGEFFVVAGGNTRRVAHLAPFPLPGGDAAIRYPWRTALGPLLTRLTSRSSAGRPVRRCH